MTQACPDANMLTDMVEGSLTQAARDRLHAHVDRCPSCANLLVELGHLAPADAQVAADDGVPRIGRYEVLGLLGRGGVGVVYLAFDPDLDRRIALKVLQRADERTQSRLLHEARAMARLSHPNVVQVHEVGTFDGGWYIAMERIEGGTLTQWARGRSWRERLAACVQAGKGLAAAHAAGLVHRDFKPSNVLCGADGRARVTDFGLVATLDVAGGSAPAGSSRAPELRWGRDPTTLTGGLLGTPAYMAPEQERAEAADERSDQFAFCVTVWEMLAGQHPFVDLAGRGVAPRAKTDALPAWPDDAPKLRRSVYAAIVRGLAPRPEDRWPTMAALLEPLQRGLKPRVWPWLVVPAAAVVAWLGWQGYEGTMHARKLARCDAAGAAINAVWNARTKAAVEAGIRGANVPFATTMLPQLAGWLDRRADTWRAQSVAACVNTTIDRRWSFATADKAGWCLDEQRVELEVLLEGLAAADAEVAVQAVQAAAAPPSSAWCTDEAVLRGLPDPPAVALRGAATEVRDALVRAQSWGRTAPIAVRIHAAQVARKQAQQRSLPALAAAASAVEVSLVYRTGDYAGAMASGREAFMAAAQIGAWDSAANVSNLLIRVAVDARAEPSEGLLWADLAQVAIAHAGDPMHLREANRLGNLSGVHVDDGRAAVGLEQASESWRLTEAAVGPEHPATARAMVQLAWLQHAAGDPDRAHATYSLAVQRLQAALGRDHPEVGVALANLGGLLSEQRREAEADDVLRRAVAILEPDYGSEHPRVALALASLGSALIFGERRAEGHALLARAEGLLVRQFGPDHPDVGAVLLTLGVWHIDEGELDAARALFERAIAIARAHGDDRSVAHALNNVALTWMSEHAFDNAAAAYRRTIEALESSSGPNHPHLAFPLSGLGEAMLVLGQAGEAIEPLERALRLRASTQTPPGQRAHTQFVLARALWQAPSDIGRDRRRARELAQAAVVGFREAGVPSQEPLAEAEAWLASHPL